MSEKNAPDIIRYECADAPEGYNFIFIDNKSEIDCYIEETVYKQFEGIELLHSFTCRGS